MKRRGEEAGRNYINESSQQIYEDTVPYYLRGLLPKPRTSPVITMNQTIPPPPPPAPSPDPSSRNPDTFQPV